ncbi:hypothetical protein MHY29_04440 [Micrococcus sp. ACRRV]|uniref:hypothetical protein n=1 Tax=Micrococcus sp. ACRRV TaxID=2918203 RepID=UPI001EF3C152|nr:hypothetical protein [Micrococcus sp. ACRRV]MCG7422088.1 hypothetical protein [Micrococcus sp. ACRRV]
MKRLNVTARLAAAVLLAAGLSAAPASAASPLPVSDGVVAEAGLAPVRDGGVDSGVRDGFCTVFPFMCDER